MLFLYSQAYLHIILIIHVYHTKVLNSTVNTKKLGIFSSFKIVQHLESVTILECAVV